MIRLKCPGCGVSLKIPDAFAGKKSPCPKCRRVVQIPAAEEPEPEVEEEELLQKAEDEEEEEEAPEEEEPEEKPAPKRGGKKPVRPAADEDEEEEAPEDEDEEEEKKPPPKKKGKKPVRRAADEDDDEEEDEEEEDKPRRKKGRGAGAKGGSFFTYKKISGMVGVVLGLGALGYGLATGFGGGWEYTQIVCVVFGALLVAAGAFYIFMP